MKNLFLITLLLFGINSIGHGQIQGHKINIGLAKMISYVPITKIKNPQGRYESYIAPFSSIGYEMVLKNFNIVLGVDRINENWIRSNYNENNITLGLKREFQLSLKHSIHSTVQFLAGFNSNNGCISCLDGPTIYSDKYLGGEILLGYSYKIRKRLFINVESGLRFYSIKREYNYQQKKSSPFFGASTIPFSLGFGFLVSD